MFSEDHAIPDRTAHVVHKARRQLQIGCKCAVQWRAVFKIMLYFMLIIICQVRYSVKYDNVKSNTVSDFHRDFESKLYKCLESRATGIQNLLLVKCIQEVFSIASFTG